MKIELPEPNVLGVLWAYHCVRTWHEIFLFFCLFRFMGVGSSSRVMKLFTIHGCCCSLSSSFGTWNRSQECFWVNCCVNIQASKIGVQGNFGDMFAWCWSTDDMYSEVFIYFHLLFYLMFNIIIWRINERNDKGKSIIVWGNS